MPPAVEALAPAGGTALLLELDLGGNYLGAAGARAIAAFLTGADTDAATARQLGLEARAGERGESSGSGGGRGSILAALGLADCSLAGATDRQ